MELLRVEGNVGVDRQPLIAMIPPHDTYIETHLGGGADHEAQAVSAIAQMDRHRPGDRPRARCVRDAATPSEDSSTAVPTGIKAEFEFQGSELV